MAPPDALVRHDERIRMIQLGTVKATRRLWGKFGFGDFDQTWKQVGPQMLLMMTAAQTAAVRSSVAYVPDVLGELGIDPTSQGSVNPKALAGIASDGRALDSLLYQPIVATRTALGQGFGLTESLDTGRSLLDKITTTQVRDASRATTSVDVATRRHVAGMFRVANLPCCSRCIVLDGRFYRWSKGFERHPGDDCEMVPGSEDMTGDFGTDTRQAIADGKVHGLSEADAKAIVEDGADPNQVINAHRGMSTEQLLGKNVKVTNEGMTRRGVAGSRLGGDQVRLRPETIYKLAGDNREAAIEMLRRFAYII